MVADTLTPSRSPSVPAQPYSVSQVVQDAEGLHNYDSTTAYADTSCRQSPEPCQTDLQGHYIGPASGVSFMLRVQKRLHQAISFSQPGSILTFGDAPLHDPSEFDPSFCMMLPREDAQRLLDRYFDYAMPTYRFLHRPTVQQWFGELYDTLGAMHDVASAPARTALLFMIFAQGRVYLPNNERPGPTDLSTRYYLAAEHLLTKEKGSIRLTSVQARLLQCCFLLTRSRINHCWCLLGTVTRLALAIGLNRNRRPDAASGMTLVEAECRRRTFWCAYTLDAFLSHSLGRPPSFNDEDIDTELPACVEDHELTPGHVPSTQSNKGPSVMLAPIAHMKLARIISRLLRSLYSIRPISANRRLILTQRISKELQVWRAELSRFLDVDPFTTSVTIPIYQRQRNVLNLTYWHAIILTYRPFLLSNFEQLSQQSQATPDDNLQPEDSVQKCLAAAMSIVNTINDITQGDGMTQAFWITAYYAFNAAIVLYIYVIQKHTAPPSVYGKYFAAASQCQSQISRMAEKASLWERYCLVLEELREEALRQTNQVSVPMVGPEGLQMHAHLPEEFQTTLLPVDDSPSNDTNYTELMGDPGIEFNGMPGSTGFQATGWEQFASMVSSGLGNIDEFPNIYF